MTEAERLQACVAVIAETLAKYGCEIKAGVLWEQVGTDAAQFRGATPKVTLIKDWKPEENDRKEENKDAS